MPQLRNPNVRPFWSSDGASAVIMWANFKDSVAPGQTPCQGVELPRRAECPASLAAAPESYCAAVLVERRRECSDHVVDFRGQRSTRSYAMPGYRVAPAAQCAQLRLPQLRVPIGRRAVWRCAVRLHLDDMEARCVSPAERHAMEVSRLDLEVKETWRRAV